jgi:hypothetical protein
MKKTFSVLGLLSFFVSQTLHAAPLVYTLAKAQPAPEAGSLLNPEATARVLAEAEYRRRQAVIGLQNAVEKERLLAGRDKAALLAETKARELALSAKLSATKEELDKAKKIAIKESKSADNWKWWLIGGILGGVAVTVGGALVVRELSK